ncbi:hypothetical protein JQM65_05845 [Faecalicatena contorta]|nr:hypothetical protein [Faecalicatena contorta]
MCLTLVLITGMVLVAKVECQASSTEAVIDGSYLLHTDESIGYATGRTRGEDLMTGYSKVVRLGPGKLYAGGTTIAAHTVERVGVAVIVERAQEGAEEWDYYADWSKFNENTDRVSSNRTLDVEGGYYYRVRCTHSANFDVSSSFTDGVFIEEP